MRPGTLLLVLAVALAIGTFVAFTRPDPGTGQTLVNSPSSPSAGALLFEPPPPAIIARAAAQAPVEEWRPDDMPALVALRYAQATDKRAFFDDAQKVGGGAHLMFAMAAYGRCTLVNTFGMVGAEQISASSFARDGAYAPRLEAFRESSKGCEAFEIRKVTSGQVTALAQRINGGDDFASLALRVGIIAQGDLARARKIVSLAIASADPYLLAEVAHFAGAAHPGDSSAWTWALCDLGYDCGPSSDLGRAACTHSGLCGWKTFDEIADRFFDRDHQPGLRARKDEILAALRARDPAKLGF